MENMRNRVRRLAARLAGLLALGLLLAACRAGDVPNTPPLAPASYQGPVPPGALARLGRGSIKAVDLSPDGSRIAIGGQVGVYLHDAGTLDEQWLVPSTSPVARVAFSRDGALVAAGLEDGSVALIDASSGSVAGSTTGPTNVTALAWSPAQAEAGALLAAGYADGQVLVWIVSGDGGQVTVERVGSLQPLTASVTALAYSHNGALLATGSLVGEIDLWEAWTGRHLGRLSGHAANHAITGLSWAPDGTTLVSGGRDGQIIVWDAVAAAPIQTIVLDGDVISLAAIGTGTELAATQEDDTLGIWDTLSAEARLSLSHLVPSPVSVVISADGKRLVAAQADGSLGVWNITTSPAAGQVARLRTDFSARGQWAATVAWSPDGERLASGSGPTVQIWDTGTGALLRTLEGHAALVTGLAWSPDGERLASGSQDKSLMVWDARSGEARLTLRQHTDGVAGVAWSADGQRLASAGSLDDSVIIWDATTGAPLQTVHSGEQGVWSVAWSADSRAVAAGTTLGHVLLWHADGTPDAEPFGLLTGHTAWVTSLAWSPDGRRLAAGSADASVIVWDTSSADRLETFRRHTHIVRGVAFSPDGRRLASVSQDDTVVVLETGTGRPDPPWQVLVGHTARVDGVAWSPDGERLASGSDDGTVIVWDVSP